MNEELFAQLPGKYVGLLKEKKLKTACAESLTGGMVSQLITQISGASEVIELGICSYSNRIKSEVLGVRQETLDVYTEYSEQTACEMAEGIRRLSGADIGIATTGIAGPSGGTAEKPVGTVYVKISNKKGTHSVRLMLNENNKNDCEQIRKLAAMESIALAVEEVYAICQ